MEDKLIGPLTLKQFVYLLVGGMILYACIKARNFTYILAIGTPAALLALCLAFIKIQDQPFSKFMTSLAFYIARPRFRVWQKDWQQEGKGTPIVQASKEPVLKKHEDQTVEKEELHRLSVVLDTKGQEKIEQLLQEERAKIVK